MNESQVIEMFSALAQDTRLQIVRYLVGCGPEGAPAARIGAEVGASSSRLSFHLAALERAKILASKRVSRSIIYRVDFIELGELTSFLLHDCCQNHPVVSECCRKTNISNADDCC